MPHLLVHAPGWRKPRAIPLHKPMVSIGADPACDVVVEHEGMQPLHATVRRAGDAYWIEAASRRARLRAGGKAVRRVRLDEGVQVEVGPATVSFSPADQPEGRGGPDPRDHLAAMQRLVDFAERLATRDDVESLLAHLLDGLIEVTEARRGFLLMLEAGTFRVRVARNMQGRDIPERDAALSDSILAKAVATRQPVLVSDALHDAEFSSSASVVNLKLHSVLCLPLVARGDLLGLIYLGNDSAANLFTEDTARIARVFAAQAALVLRSALALDEVRASYRQLKEALDAARFGEVIGACPSMREVYWKIERVAPTDVSVLVQGETGTGKELVAREIHRRSARANGPFVVINCGAIPENLLESELFGHVRGAFTGATATVPGKFQAAHGGTLFLDEIGEMPAALQVKLLRALQERKVTRVGSTRPESVDIRVVAATNKVLADEVRAGRFREDLFYRLHVVAITLPPLRERGDDVILLARYLLRRYAAEFGVGHRELSEATLNALRRHSWPGNVRELENRIKKAVVLSDSAVIEPRDLDLDEAIRRSVLPLAEAKERFQQRYIDRVLALNDGNRTRAARDLGVDPRTVFRHLEKKRRLGGEQADDDRLVREAAADLLE